MTAVPLLFHTPHASFLFFLHSRCRAGDHWRLATGVAHLRAAGLSSVFGEPRGRPLVGRVEYDNDQYKRVAGRLAKRPALAEPHSYTPTHSTAHAALGPPPAALRGHARQAGGRAADRTRSPSHQSSHQSVNLVVELDVRQSRRLLALPCLALRVCRRGGRDSLTTQKYTLRGHKPILTNMTCRWRSVKAARMTPTVPTSLAKEIC
jgi:hypothetical protein